jgi:hypothetical protein
MPLPPRRGIRQPSQYATLAGCAGAGMAFGLLAASVNAVSSANPGVEALSQVLGVGWSWAGAGVLAGAAAMTWPRSAAVLTMLPAVLGYYLVDLCRGVYLALDPRDPLYIVDPAHASTITEWAALGGDLTRWGVTALLLGPVLGLVGAGTHRSDAVGVACRLAVPTGATVEMLAIHLPYAARLEPRPVVLATTITVSLVAMLTAVAIVARHAHGRIHQLRSSADQAHGLISSDGHRSRRPRLRGRLIERGSAPQRGSGH